MQRTKSAIWRATLLTAILLPSLVACKQQSRDDNERTAENVAEDTADTGLVDPQSATGEAESTGEPILELPPASNAPTAPGDAQSVPSADATASRGPRVITNHVPGHPYHRTVTLRTERDTSVERSGRQMQASDRLRTTLDFTYVVLAATANRAPREVLIDVRDVQHIVNGELQQDARLPNAGQRLRCEADRDAILSCVHRDSGEDVAWPRWAPLDYNRWMAPNVMRPGARWQRSSSRATGLGFEAEHLDEATLQFEVLSIDPISEPSFIQLNVEADGNLRWDVLGQTRNVELSGTGSVLYQQDLQLMTRLEFGWQAELQTDGVYNGASFDWARREAVRIRVQTSTPATPPSLTTQPQENANERGLLQNTLRGMFDGGNEPAAPNDAEATSGSSN